MFCFHRSTVRIIYSGVTRGLSQGGKAGLSKFGARLEALLRGPTQWHMKKFFIGHQVIMVEIVDVKGRGLGHDPQFQLSSRDFNGQRRNKFMSYYTQYFHREGIECSNS